MAPTRRPARGRLPSYARTMNQENVIHQVIEVRQVDQEKCNELLGTGKWVLLGVADGQSQHGPHDIMPYFQYSVGRYK
jgi:hypothetical protein